MKIKATYETNDEEPNEEEVQVEWYEDLKTGEGLDPQMVKQAREEKLEFMKKIGLFELVPVEDCWKSTGKDPITTKWVDVNKGSAERPDVRCRLVARDFKPKGEAGRADLFAAMPPLEAKKLLFQKAAVENARNRARGKEGIKIMFVDVKKAHLNGFLEKDEEAFVWLPAEANAGNRCGRLRRWLYGMRPAASAWEREYSDMLAEIGFAKGLAAPTVFFCKEKDIRCVVHGDDFTFTGLKKDLLDVAKSMKDAYELKVRAILGDEQEDDKKITILNRNLSWSENGLEYEADDKHVTAILDYFGLDETSKGAEAPSIRETSTTILEHSEPLNAKMKTEFRGLAARANYLSLDRMDIQHATKEACREMSAPTEKSLAKMKHLARYLLNFPRATIRFQDTVETNDQVIDVFSDSDWAGCLKTRRSTSGGAMMVAGGLVKTWSSTQATVAQSSGEAEYYALVRAASEALGLQSIMKDLGWQASIRLWVDSSAAKSIASRVGLGRVRHLEVKFLWLQQTVKDKRIGILKIRGDSNPADVLTKPKSHKDIHELLLKVGVDIKAKLDSNRAFTVYYLENCHGEYVQDTVRVQSWADALEEGAPRLPYMSRTLRPYSDRSVVVGGCRLNNMLTQTCSFRQ
jgi:hypothetical protein